MSHKGPEFHVSEEAEVGLVLPNGTEIWPPETFHGRGLTTGEDRNLIVQALHDAAVNLGTDPEELLNQYRWVTRMRQHYLTVNWSDPMTVPITTAAFIEVPQPETPVGIDTEDVVPVSVDGESVPEPATG